MLKQVRRAGFVGSFVIGLATVAGAQTAPAGAPTFTKDVAPILQRSCVTCHRPGQSAPMSLRTYEDVRPWARSIKTLRQLVVMTAAMPPLPTIG